MAATWAVKGGVSQRTFVRRARPPPTVTSARHVQLLAMFPSILRPAGGWRRPTATRCPSGVTTPSLRSARRNFLVQRLGGGHGCDAPFEHVVQGAVEFSIGRGNWRRGENIGYRHGQSDDECKGKRNVPVERGRGACLPPNRPWRAMSKARVPSRSPRDRRYRDDQACAACRPGYAPQRPRPRARRRLPRWP